MGKIKNKKTIIILSVLLLVVIGVTIAYFSNSDIFDNIFNTKPYGSTYTEEFVSPDNWLPGDVTDKTVEVENTGDVDQAVRISYTESWSTHNNGTLNGWIHSDGTKSTHTTETELSTDERAAVINFANTDDWTKVGDYYYYNYKLAPNDKTSSFIESVTFNPLTKLDDTCTETNNNGVKTISCSSSGDDYDNAAYTLTLTIETVQYNKYNEAWNLNNSVTIAAEKPISGVQSLLSKVNPKSIINYTEGDIHEMYTFEHEETEQTDALTDYRYIGNDPYNYVYFNCDDLSNQSSETCEIWRIIGVFDVENSEGNFETRIKLIKNDPLEKLMSWDVVNPDDNDYDWDGYNNWKEASLNKYLNETYYNNELKDSSKSMIEITKYYLGGKVSSPDSPYYGTTEEIYVWERGMVVINPETDSSCNSVAEETGKCAIRLTNWNGMVGLMYLSDNYYTYSKTIDDICYNDPYNCSEREHWMSLKENPGYPEKGWIYNNSNDGFWTMSPSADSIISVFMVLKTSHESAGRVGAASRNSVMPVVYLSSSVKIIDGDGSSGNSYKLSL